MAFAPFNAIVTGARTPVNRGRDLTICILKFDTLAQRVNFAFESTLAGRTYAAFLTSLRDSGYEVHLFYFWLNSVELAIARVAARVKKGGHHVPDATVRHRYDRSLRNLFHLYLPIVNSWKVYDNSLVGSPMLVAEGMHGANEIIYSQDVWSQMRSILND